MTDTYIARWHDDHVESVVTAQLLIEGRADDPEYDLWSAIAARESLEMDGDYPTLAALYERYTGWNPYKQGE